ncbi:hypothetical protein L6164_028305 [Bauhinia variegata]|uniref:Uncharacterized protein n=1 Tax=Bauhinia variegata TaxID=167791 RepID=A0ACB9LVR4_BAUVA|nr:hypothetical protein L6164_028305 [Bauhinia variegata]
MCPSSASQGQESYFTQRGTRGSEANKSPISWKYSSLCQLEKPKLSLEMRKMSEQTSVKIVSGTLSPVVLSNISGNEHCKSNTSVGKIDSNSEKFSGTRDSFRNSRDSVVFLSYIVVTDSASSDRD